MNLKDDDKLLTKEDLEWCFDKLEKLQKRAFTSEKLLMKITASHLFYFLFGKLHQEIINHLSLTTKEELREWDEFFNRIRKNGK